jgi:hypothetical protein
MNIFLSFLQSAVLVKEKSFGFAHYSLEDVQGGIRQWKSSFLTQLSKAAKLSLHALSGDSVWIHICNGVYPKRRIKPKTYSCFARDLYLTNLNAISFHSRTSERKYSKNGIRSLYRHALDMYYCLYRYFLLETDRRKWPDKLDGAG